MKFRLDPLAPNGISTVYEEAVIINGSSSSSGGTTTTGIPQYDTDPADPAAEDAWVLRSGGGGVGGGVVKAILGGGFMASSVGSGGAFTYQFSYRTQEGTTKRATLS